MSSCIVVLYKYLGIFKNTPCIFIMFPSWLNSCLLSLTMHSYGDIMSFFEVQCAAKMTVINRVTNINNVFRISAMSYTWLTNYSPWFYCISKRNEKMGWILWIKHTKRYVLYPAYQLFTPILLYFRKKLKNGVNFVNLTY